MVDPLRRTVRTKRRFSYPIANFDQLLSALRRGRLLIKTYRSRQGPVFEVDGALCDPWVAKEAITGGLLQPVDQGLFGAASAQSWTIRKISSD
jgi:hypothetical protein